MRTGDEESGDRGQEVRAKVFVCSSGRTGSTLLCRAMQHYGIGAPVEYFNAGRISDIAKCYNIEGLADGTQLGSNAAARSEYIDTLLRQRTVNGIFASKIHWGQYAMYLNNTDGDRLLNHGHFIYLYRRDLLAQAISRHIATETGRWGWDDRETGRASAVKQFFDVDRIEGHLRYLAAEEVNWRVYFAQNGINPLTLIYEDFTYDLEGSLRTIVDAFGLDLPIAASEFIAPVPTAARDLGVPSRQEIRAHFLRSRRRIEPSPTIGIQSVENSRD